MRTLHTYLLSTLFFIFSSFQYWVEKLVRIRLQATIYKQATKTIFASKRPSVLSLYFRHDIENIYELKREINSFREWMSSILDGLVALFCSFKIWQGYAIWHTVCYLARFLNVISIYTHRYNRGTYVLARCAWLQSMQETARWKNTKYRVKAKENTCNV